CRQRTTHSELVQDPRRNRSVDRAKLFKGRAPRNLKAVPEGVGRSGASRSLCAASDGSGEERPVASTRSGHGSSKGRLDDGIRLTVAAVAARLGVAASTLRTWERRYGLGPSARTAGRHRRYDAVDVTRLETMR